MTVEKIWRKELAKRIRHERRRDRVNRNWPVHAEVIYEVFRRFALVAQKDKVFMSVRKPEFHEPSIVFNGSAMGEFPLGSSSVNLCLGLMHTGEGLITHTAERSGTSLDYERGAEIIVYHSYSEGSVQVFFECPVLSTQDEALEPLLYTYTYNTDDLTVAWAEKIISAFMVFYRCESSLQQPSWVDTIRMRWWRFTDVRNKRGYLEKFQHLLTPWELVILAAVVAIPGFAAAQWIWKNVL